MKKKNFIVACTVIAAIAAAAVVSCHNEGWEKVLDIVTEVHTGGIGAGENSQMVDGRLFIKQGAAKFSVALDNERSIAMRVKANGIKPDGTPLDPGDISFLTPGGVQLVEVDKGFFYLPKPAQSVVIEITTGAAPADLGMYRLTLETMAGDWGMPFEPRVISAECRDSAKFPVVAKLNGVYYANLQDAVSAAAAGTPTAPDVITVLADFQHSGAITLSGKHIRLTVPRNAGRTITLATGYTGNVFVIQGGSSLTFAGNGSGVLALDGNKTAGVNLGNYSLIFVDNGLLRLENGAVLRNAKKTASAPIHVAGNGSFTMSGGSLTGMEGVEGGAVHVAGGTFTMSGGVISGNSESGTTGYPRGGGGVLLNGSSAVFTMSGGTISGNTVNGDGGGVFNYFGVFTMSGGTISGNTAGGSGGGVINNSTFTLKGGTIFGNTANGGGGGVHNNSTFTMESGEISNNTSSSRGGGVANGNMFTLKGGRIRGNRALNGNNLAEGGGVHNGSTFTMEGGEISNNTVSGSAGTGIMGGIGGGVSTGGGTFTMPGGRIFGNNVTCTSGEAWGGGVYYGGGACTMSGGEISGNYAAHKGGGVFVSDYNLEFKLQGTALIQGNNAGNSGKGVYVRSTASYQGTLGMEGGARVAANNEVYLATNTTIKLNEALTAAAPVATILPENTAVGTQILSPMGGTWVSDYYNKFRLHSSLSGRSIGSSGALGP